MMTMIMFLSSHHDLLVPAQCDQHLHRDSSSAWVSVAFGKVSELRHRQDAYW